VEINSQFSVDRVSDLLQELKSVKLIFTQQNRLSYQQIHLLKLDFAKEDLANRLLQNFSSHYPNIQRTLNPQFDRGVKNHYALVHIPHKPIHEQECIDKGHKSAAGG
jgi:hypothetical protein